MTLPPVSVVVVSRGRPADLTRCLTAVSQLQYPAFEVVVVADPQGVSAAQALPFAEAFKIVAFDVANISAARNAGIDEAAGDIVGFLDDDAVPEPSWLQALLAPAQDLEVGVMGGFVRGRNGISWQWRGRGLDDHGEAYALQTADHGPAVFRDRAIKTEGTNMAVRRSVLVACGGFDPAFHYFLDETDLNMRLAGQGFATALVPDAEVHHGFAMNAMRRADRVPRDLFDIGASWAVFQRKHVPSSARASQWDRLRGREKARLLRYMVTGQLEPRDVRRLMSRLETGFATGATRTFSDHSVSPTPKSPFQAFPSERRTSVFLATCAARYAQTLQHAAELVADGHIATVLSLSRTAAFHKVFFTDEGVWVQRGGLYGRSERDMPLFAYWPESDRSRYERDRVMRQRIINNG